MTIAKYLLVLAVVSVGESSRIAKLPGDVGLGPNGENVINWGQDEATKVAAWGNWQNASPIPLARDTMETALVKMYPGRDRKLLEDAAAWLRTEVAVSHYEDLENSGRWHGLAKELMSAFKQNTMADKEQLELEAFLFEELLPKFVNGKPTAMPAPAPSMPASQDVSEKKEEDVADSEWGDDVDDDDNEQVSPQLPKADAKDDSKKVEEYEEDVTDSEWDDDDDDEDEGVFEKPKVVEVAKEVDAEDYFDANLWDGLEVPKEPEAKPLGRVAQMRARIEREEAMRKQSPKLSHRETIATQASSKVNELRKKFGE